MTNQMFVCKAVHWLLLSVACCIGHEYMIDNSAGRGRRFDGVGAISGGGVRVLEMNAVFHERHHHSTNSNMQY